MINLFCIIHFVQNNQIGYLCHHEKPLHKRDTI